MSIVGNSFYPSWHETSLDTASSWWCHEYGYPTTAQYYHAMANMSEYNKMAEIKGAHGSNDTAFHDAAKNRYQKQAYFTQNCHRYRGLFVVSLITGILFTSLCVGCLFLRQMDYRFSWSRCWVCLMEQYDSCSCADCIDTLRDTFFRRPPQPFSRKRLSRIRDSDMDELKSVQQETGAWKAYIEPPIGGAKPRRVLVPHSRVGSIDDMHAQLRESIVAAIPTIDLDSLDANPLGCEDCPVTLQYFAEDDAVVFVDKFCNMQALKRAETLRVSTVERGALVR